MSAFWGGFAAKGVEYIDEARKNSLDKAKLEDERKFETTEWDRRNAVKRDEKLKDDELQYARDSYFKPENISEDDDGVWFTTLIPDATGKLTFSRAPASEAQKSVFVREKEDRALKVEGDKLDNKSKRVNIAADEQKIGLDALDSASRRRVDAAQIKKFSEAPDVEIPKHINAFGESLAKNKNLRIRHGKELDFKNVLSQYGFNSGPELGIAFMNRDSKAIEAMGKAQHMLYFPASNKVSQPRDED